ncbi:hypothetical protein [Lysinibacillus xylanilyticus]|uniref:hypothetical protein n=1 Tax=Lysinibacillus xylanilyticus TaxID=582475 RepID=UPI003CFE9C7E
MANTKAELLAEIIAYSGEIYSANQSIEHLMEQLSMAKENVANIEQNIGEKESASQRAEALLGVAAAELTKLTQKERD